MGDAPRSIKARRQNGADISWRPCLGTSALTHLGATRAFLLNPVATGFLGRS